MVIIMVTDGVISIASYWRCIQPAVDFGAITGFKLWSPLASSCLFSLLLSVCIDVLVSAVSCCFACYVVYQDVC